MASADCLDAWDDCFNFFKGKSPYHTTRHTTLSHFTRNQRVGWKLMGALGVFISSVFLQSLCLAWEGYFSDGREKMLPLMLFGPMSALYSVIAILQPCICTNRRSMGLEYCCTTADRAQCSWEILDWVFFEGSTTSTVVSFVFFWVVTLPHSDITLVGLHAFGTIAHMLIVAVDFYFTAPLFKSNHVFLVLMWPVFWVFVQYFWVISGHQPTNNLFNFHSTASPVATFMLFLGTVLVFYVLLCYSRHLQRVSDRSTDAAVDTGGMDSDESSSCLTPTYENGSTAPFELVMESSADNRSPFDSKTISSADFQHKQPR
ncbi:hypothetical protein KRP22_012515 [Phytophthora ramorum]|nr:hypothetical protein KRP22_13087 [Phytophthora ramorum]